MPSAASASTSSASKGNGSAPTIEALKTTSAEEPLTPSGGRAIKHLSRAGIPVRLPGCGEVVLLRRPSLMGMAMKGGRVPNPLTDEVLRYIAVDSDVLSKFTPDEQVENWRENATVMIQIASLCFVHPRLILDRDVDDDNDDEIGPMDLTGVDYRFLIFTFVEGDAAALAPFLEPARTRGAASARS